MGEIVAGQAVKPKVSVVMPVYNTGQYVEEAIRSITGQTVRDLELIAVNDGSTDDSLEVMQRLAAEDSRIKVLSQPNSGQSVARNLALKEAKGDYVYFMDSDDRLDPDTFELCYAKCEADRLDFVIFDADVFCEIPGYKHKFDYRRSHKLEDKLYTGMELLDTLLAVRGYSVSPCLLLINRDYLERIGISFYPGIIHEDELFAAQLYIPAGRVGRIDRTFFHRRVRPSSVMTSAYSARTIKGYTTVLEQLDIYSHGKEAPIQKMVRRLMRGILGAVMYNASSMPRKDRMGLLRLGLSRYPGLLDPKSCLVLLAPGVKILKDKLLKG